MLDKNSVRVISFPPSPPSSLVNQIPSLELPDSASEEYLLILGPQEAQPGSIEGGSILGGSRAGGQAGVNRHQGPSP